VRQEKKQTPPPKQLEKDLTRKSKKDVTKKEVCRKNQKKERKRKQTGTKEVSSLKL